MRKCPELASGAKHPVRGVKPYSFVKPVFGPRSFPLRGLGKSVDEDAPYVPALEPETQDSIAPADLKTGITTVKR
jgi:hypothetical protein